jgi:SAM-dependent methyltransferase
LNSWLEALLSFWEQLEHGRVKPWLRQFKPYRSAELGGIRVAYKKHLDGGGREFGQDFIPFLRRRAMPRQQRVFEWCAGPGFIGFSLLGHGLAQRLCLADVNPAAVAACHRTVRDNSLADRVTIYLSDNLAAIPASEHFDLVVSNPPHFADQFEREFGRGDRRAHDPGWRIHRDFFHNIGRFLNPGGVIVLQENNQGSSADTFRDMIADAGLAMRFVDGEMPPARDPQYYYIGLTRREDAPPDWARG